MGVIKGSEASLGSSKGLLDRRTYEGLSSRACTAFSRERQQVYSLFEAYQKRRPLGSYDAADRYRQRSLRWPQWLTFAHARTRSLLAACKGGSIGASVDFLYVDEVQDNLIVDVAGTLRFPCSRR